VKDKTQKTVLLYRYMMMTNNSKRDRSEVSKSIDDIQNSDSVRRKGGCRELSSFPDFESTSSTTTYSELNKPNDTNGTQTAGRIKHEHERYSPNQHDMHDEYNKSGSSLEDGNDDTPDASYLHHTRRDFRVYAEEFEPGHEIFQAIEEVLNGRRDNNNTNYSYR
jgi:hypothetical protein